MQTRSAVAQRSTPSAMSPARDAMETVCTGEPSISNLRQHEGRDFIRLAASGQAEDAKRQRLNLCDQAGISLDNQRIRRFRFRPGFLLPLATIQNDLPQALQDELVLAFIEFAKLAMCFGQSQRRNEHRVVDFRERLVLEIAFQQFRRIF